MPRSLLLTDADQAKLRELCEKAFPNRSESIMTQIVDEAQWLFYPTRSDSENVEAIASLSKTKDEAFTRATPSADDYVKHAEQAAKDLGRIWSAQDRMAALRRAQGMTPDELLKAVPLSQRQHSQSAPKSADNSAPLTTEALDAEITRRTGVDARQMLVSDRRRYHAEIQRASVKPAPASSSNARWQRRMDSLRGK